jgi:hypothetical protein
MAAKSATTYSQLRQFTTDLRDLGRGGMYLSRGAWEAYGKVQEALGAVLVDDKDRMANGSDYEVARTQCSKLRSKLTDDLLSHREAPDVLPVARA